MSTREGAQDYERMVYSSAMLVKTPSISLLPYFVRAAQLTNFSAVAREMGVSAVAVSKAIASLENQLGVRLFQRSTRSIALTEEGRQLFESCEGPLQALQEGARALGRHRESGLVRISCVPPFGKTVLIPMLRRFWRLHPQVRIELVLESRNADLIRDGFDVGIRVGPPSAGDVISRRLAGLSFVLCASPEYFAQHGVPLRIEDLRRFSCLRLGSSERESEFTWTIGAAKEVRVRGDFVAPDMWTLESAALAGLGLFQAPLPLVMPHFRSGALRPVLPEALREGLALHVHYRSRKNLPTRTRTFLDYLQEEARTHPDLSADPQAICRPYWAQPM